MKDETERYFLITCYVVGSFHELLIETKDGFPSRDYIHDRIKKVISTISPNDFFIMNIYEFKSERDYKDYSGK
jgi:hypothetical protein